MTVDSNKGKKVSPYGPETSADGTPAIPMWIGGRAYLAMPAHGFFDLRNTDTSAVLRRVPLCGSDTVSAACASASQALAEVWPHVARNHFLHALKPLLEKYAPHLQGLSAQESQATADQDLEELIAAIQELSEGAHGDDTPELIALIVFSDASLTGAARAVLEGLMCGKAFVVKTSVRCPSALLAFAEILSRAGLPPGRCNVVHGETEAVEALCAEPAVQALECSGRGGAYEAVARIAEQAGKPCRLQGQSKAR